VYIACFRPIDHREESKPSKNFQYINFEELEQQKWDLKASVLDAYGTYFLYLSIGLHASIFVDIVGNPMFHIFPCIILVTRDWVEH
jgi:hypothetical protein